MISFAGLPGSFALRVLFLCRFALDSFGLLALLRRACLLFGLGLSLFGLFLFGLRVTGTSRCGRTGFDVPRYWNQVRPRIHQGKSLACSRNWSKVLGTVDVIVQGHILFGALHENVHDGILQGIINPARNCHIWPLFCVSKGTRFPRKESSFLEWNPQ